MVSKKFGSGDEPDLNPDDYEDIDLPGGPEGEADLSQFEGSELDLSGESTVSEELQQAHAELEQRLILGVADVATSAASGTDAYGFENIMGVGIGEKEVEGQPTGEPCVTIFVMAKAPKNQIDSAALVPSEIGGVATDVVATGEILAQPYRGRYRPAPGGVSVGHFKVTAGTLGCLVTKQRKLFILSNNHVLANSNAARLGDPIVQPGTYDGGRVPRDVIAILSQFIPINFAGKPNLVDAAIAQTKVGLVRAANIKYGPILRRVAPCRIGMAVKKAGRTTQFTRGRVTSCNATLRVNYGSAGTAVFQRQIVVQSVARTPFSAGGDSGTPIVTDGKYNYPVGLLFAGSSTHTIANPFSTVLSALGVTVVG